MLKKAIIKAPIINNSKTPIIADPKMEEEEGVSPILFCCDESIDFPLIFSVATSLLSCKVVSSVWLLSSSNTEAPMTTSIITAGTRTTKTGTSIFLSEFPPIAFARFSTPINLVISTTKKKNTSMKIIISENRRKDGPKDVEMNDAKNPRVIAINSPVLGLNPLSNCNAPKSIADTAIQIIIPLILMIDISIKLIPT